MLLTLTDTVQVPSAPRTGLFFHFPGSPHSCGSPMWSGETEEKQGWALIQRALKNGQNNTFKGETELPGGSQSRLGS